MVISAYPALFTKKVGARGLRSASLHGISRRICCAYTRRRWRRSAYDKNDPARIGFCQSRGDWQKLEPAAMVQPFVVVFIHGTVPYLSRIVGMAG